MNREQLLELHCDVCVKARLLMERKNKDYSKDSDPFSNFRGSETFKVNPVLGIMVRMQDKLSRISNFVNNGQLYVQEESVEDNIQDIINYAILALGLIKDNRKEKILPSSGGEATHPTGNTCSHIERTTDKESRAAYTEEAEEKERWAKERQYWWHGRE